MGRALLEGALHGTREADLPRLDPSVVDGAPARRRYDAVGFPVLQRLLAIELPA